MQTIKKLLWYGILLTMLILLIEIRPVYASGYGALDHASEEKEDTDYKEVIDLYDFSQVQQKINADIGIYKEVDFKAMVEELVTNGVSFRNDVLVDMISHIFVSEIAANRNSILEILTLAIFCALLTNLTGVFQGTKTAELGFQVSYMCIISFMLTAFQITYQLASGILEKIVDFMRALLPAYVLSFAYTGGSMTTVAYYEICLGVISVVELLLMKIMLPMLLIYMNLLLLNSLSKEDVLKRMAELLRTLLEWGLKTIMAAVVGIQILQNLLLPYIDSLKGNVFHRAVSALPGVGNTISAFAEVIIGSGILVKNAIGVAAIIIIAAICIIPLIKIAVITLMYMAASAIVEPFSDPRLTEGISSVCKANQLLLKLVFCGILLFVITLALLCATGNTIIG